MKESSVRNSGDSGDWIFLGDWQMRTPGNVLLVMNMKGQALWMTNSVVALHGDLPVWREPTPRNPAV